MAKVTGDARGTWNEVPPLPLRGLTRPIFLQTHMAPRPAACPGIALQPQELAGALGQHPCYLEGQHTARYPLGYITPQFRSLLRPPCSHCKPFKAT